MADVACRASLLGLCQVELAPPLRLHCFLCARLDRVPAVVAIWMILMEGLYCTFRFRAFLHLAYLQLQV